VVAQYTINHNGTGHLSSAALRLTWYRALFFRFFHISDFFRNRGSCIVTHFEENLSISVCKMLQSELQTRLSLTQQNTTKQTKVTEQPVTGLSPTDIPRNMQHSNQNSPPQ
jgi:hypothetical protein